MMRLLIYFLFFLSGAAGLIYQLVWVRKLVLIFGNTTYATSSILTAFMGGLALGSYLLGKYADRIEKPLRAYGYLELGIGVSAVAILYLFLPLSDAVYVGLFRAIGNNGFVFNVARFLLSVLILLIPTTLMGGTLPIISRHFIRISDNFGKLVARLYGFNTVGAVVGAFMTGFVLIETFGVNTTLWIAIVTNFAVGIIAFLLDSVGQTERAPNKGAAGRAQTRDPNKEATSGRISSYTPSTARLALWMFAVAGFVSLAYEVVFTRALIFFISSTTYSFTIILVIFLTGISLGSFVMSRWVDRVKNLLFWFGIFEAFIALTAILSIPLFLNLTTVQNLLLARLNAENWSDVSLVLFLSASIILLLPTFFMGAVFPVVNRIYVRSVKNVGQGVGTVYMANTVGAILGSFLSGFVILPLIGLNNTILALALTNLTIAVLLILREKGMSLAKTYGYSGAAVALFVAIVVLTFTTRPLYLSTAGFQGTRLLHHKDSAVATVSVLEKKDQLNIWGRNVRYLNVNGHNTAHTTFSDMIIHKMLAHLPMLLVPNPRDVLVVGFGFGNTCRSFLDYDLVEQVDCVELVGHEKATAQYFEEENKGVFEDERFNFIVNDGRNFILATEAKYDVISVNSVDPKFSPTLYTEDFYRLCWDRLNNDGQLIVWLPIYGMKLEEVQALVKSFINVFPHSTLWYNNPEHLLLSGVKGKYYIDVARVKQRMEAPAISKSLGEIHLNDPYTFLSTFFCGGQMLSRFAGSVLSHSDNNPIVEFSQVPTNDMVLDVYEKLLQCRETVLSYSVNYQALGEVESERKRVLEYETEMKNLIADFFTYRIFAANPQYAREVNDILAQMHKILDSEPENDFALLQYVDLINHEDLAINEQYFQRATEIAPGFAKAYVLLGLNYATQNDWDKASEFYRRALEINDRYRVPIRT